MIGNEHRYPLVLWEWGGGRRGIGSFLFSVSCVCVCVSEGGGAELDNNFIHQGVVLNKNSIN